MPAAAIFDLDGTLLDTLDDLADSANEALSAHGHPVHPVNSFRTFVGDGMAVLMERILPEAARTPEQIGLLLSRYRTAYDARWRLKTQPYPGIVAMLRELASRGIPMAVLSNKPQAYTEIVVAHFLGEHRFEVIFGQRDTVPRKPDPAGAIEIAEQLNLPPAEILFVGDTSTDMDTATAAGMIPVGALWGFRPEAELRAHGAQFLIAEPAALLPLLRAPGKPAGG
ncbi:MAG: HAD family hydrolase [Verrucomicrobiota bacterium]